MKEDNTNQVAEQLISLINQQIEEKLATKDFVTRCVILAKNEGTDLFTVALVSDPELKSIPNIPNRSGYDFNIGDVALLYRIGGNLSDSFIISKATLDSMRGQISDEINEKVENAKNALINTIKNIPSGGGGTVVAGVTSISGVQGIMGTSKGISVLGQNIVSTQPVSEREFKESDYPDIGSGIYLYDTEN
mgnify:CR=1 FL=1